MTAAERPWWGPFREGDDALLLHVDLRPDQAREVRAVALLDAEERSRWDRLRAGRPRRQFALCRAALRIHLAEHLGCANRELSFGYLDHGKPFARVRGTPAGIHFNVSHSGAHGLLAVAARGAVGVDLEVRKPRDDFDGIGRRVYGPSERAALAAAEDADKARLFYRLWSLKEALLKALGAGFSLSPARFEVPPAMLGGARSAVFRFPHLPDAFFRLEDHGETRFAAALAYRLAAPVEAPGDGLSAAGSRGGGNRPLLAGPGPSGRGQFASASGSASAV